MKLVDCQGLAGAWTLGAVQAGFQLGHRVSLPGGFGDEVVEANRHLLTGDWEQETGDPTEKWTPQEGVAALFGTPPCSGFSLLNISKKENARGEDSGINSCMKELTAYGGRCIGRDGKPGAEIISLESVQGAFKQGRGLMREMRYRLEDITGEKYSLTHVLMSGASVGAAQMRHRYFGVWHRVPFGVEDPVMADLPDGRVVTYQDAISDLEGLSLSLEAQPYPPSDTLTEFQFMARSNDGLVDWHDTDQHERTLTVVEEVCARGWPEGYNLPGACMINGARPPSMEKAWDEEKQEYGGWRWPARIKRNRSGWVLTGGAAGEYIHYSLPRLLTIRECARLMGYPDNWLFPTSRPGTAGSWIGKCCPVDSGRWIASKFIKALNEEPEARNQEIGDREYLHNSTLIYKKWPGGWIPPREKVAA